MKNAYEKAKLRHDAAFMAFDAVRKQYRAREIDDAPFLKARAIYDQETKIFDAAFEKASN